MPVRSCEESQVRFVVLVELVVVAERGQKRVEGGPVRGRNFEAGEDAAEIGAVIPIVEQADVPASAERVEELEQRAGTLRELEAADALVFDVRRPSADHVPDVQL